MTAQFVVFLLVAVGTGATAIMVVTSRNLVHAALYLAVTLTGIAGVFLVLHADFVALVQLLVYVGAVAVLFLFGLMLTRAPIGREALDSQSRGLGAAVAGLLFVVLTVLIVQAFAGAAATAPRGPAIADLGLALFSVWVLPFEIASMLLLGALIGAIVLSRREAGDSGEEGAATRIEMGAEPAPDLPGGPVEREGVEREPVGSPGGRS